MEGGMEGGGGGDDIVVCILKPPNNPKSDPCLDFRPQSK